MLPHWVENDQMVDGKRIHDHRTGRGEKNPLVLGNIPDVGHRIRFNRFPVFVKHLHAFFKQVP